MNHLFKFNQRAELVDENAANFSFGVSIKKNKDQFSFDLINNKDESIPFISCNEWKIYAINAEPYFSRLKLRFRYSDPLGSMQTLMSSGRTISDNGDMARSLLQPLLLHFHRISCFENVESVINKQSKVREKNKYKYDPLFSNF